MNADEELEIMNGEDENDQEIGEKTVGAHNIVNVKGKKKKTTKPILPSSKMIFQEQKARRARAEDADKKKEKKAKAKNDGEGKRQIPKLPKHNIV